MIRPRALVHFLLAALTLVGVIACDSDVKVLDQKSPATGELVAGKIDDRLYRSALSVKILVPEGTQVCSGTLIAEDLLLTAAHCLNGTHSPLAPNQLTAYATARLIEYGSGTDFVRHPRFAEDPRRFDLALVRVRPSTLADATLEIFRRDYRAVTLIDSSWTPDSTQNLVLTGAGIKAGYLEAPFQPPVSEAGAFQGRVGLDRAGTLTSLWDLFRTSRFQPGDLIELSANEKSPWLCAGDSGGGLYVENDKKELLLAGVNARSKIYEFQGKSLCMPSGMVVTPVAPYLEWIARAAEELRRQ